MKVIYLHQYFCTPSMSSGTRSYEMARRLVKKGHKVYMISSKHSHSEIKERNFSIEEGVHVWWLPVKYSNNMNFIQRIYSFIVYCIYAYIIGRKLNYGLVLASSTPLTVAIPGIFLSKIRKVPFILEVRDLWPAIPIELRIIRNVLLIKLSQYLERISYRLSDKIIALSYGMRDGIINTGINKSKITVIPNGSDIELFNINSKSDIGFIDQTDWLNTDRDIIIYTGAIGKINGLSYMAFMAEEMIKLNPNVLFCIIGDGVEKDKVNLLAKKLGIMNNNFYMVPKMSKKKLPQILSISTVLTSFVINEKILWNNSANKFFDGLAAGKPLMINYGGWQADLLNEYDAGIVVSPDDPIIGAKKLNNLLQDKPRLQNMGKAGLELAKTVFNRNKLYKSFENVLLEASN
tara:strand:+ start:226 stop:1437 length:1212 start_codon:yes stop_codon:yes gene_type:complete